MAISLTRISTIVCILMGVAMLDTCMLALSSPQNHFKAIAGQQIYITGKTTRPVDSDPRFAAPNRNSDRLDEILSYEPHYQELQIRFLSVKGRLWRGVLETLDTAPEGDYPLRIFGPWEKSPQEAAAFLIRIFKDEESYRASFWSLSKRLLGWEPWWVVLALLPVALFCLVKVVGQVSREDAALQAQGVGPIYKLSKQKTHWEVLFGLGASHGVTSGESLWILDASLNRLGTIEVLEVASEFSKAKLPLDADIAPDYLIARKGASKPNGP